MNKKKIVFFALLLIIFLPAVLFVSKKYFDASHCLEKNDPDGFLPFHAAHIQLNENFIIRLLESRSSSYLPNSIRRFLLSKYHPFDSERQDFKKNIEDLESENNPESIVGYTKEFCFSINDDITIHYASDVLPSGCFIEAIKFYDSVTKKLVCQKHLKPRKYRLKRQRCYSFGNDGCQFQKTIKFNAKYLGCGEYYAVLEDDLKKTSHPIYFNIRPALNRKEKKPSIIVMFPNFTWHAYSIYGGQSLYCKANCANKKCAYEALRNPLCHVSVNRPVRNNFNHHATSSLTFLDVLRSENILYTTTSNSDLHDHPEILDHADILILTSHDEYWTQEIRDAIDRFIKRGGHVANFSGNLCWWKVNFIKNSIFVDRERGPNEKKPKEFDNTGLWNSPKINRCISKTFGLSWYYAQYPVKRIFEDFKKSNLDFITQADLDKGYDIRIINPEHAIFDGLNYKENDLWNGKKYYLVDVELDGVPLDENDKLDESLLSLPSDSTLKVLGTAYAVPTDYLTHSDGTSYYLKTKDGREYVNRAFKIGIIVEYKPSKDSGTTISIGTMGYSNALKLGDPIARKVFVNTIRYLQSLKHHKK